MSQETFDGCCLSGWEGWHIHIHPSHTVIDSYHERRTDDNFKGASFSKQRTLKLLHPFVLISLQYVPVYAVDRDLF